MLSPHSQHVVALLSAGTSLRKIARWIDDQPLPQEERDALWLTAWLGVDRGHVILFPPAEPDFVTVPAAATPPRAVRRLVGTIRCRPDPTLA